MPPDPTSLPPTTPAPRYLPIEDYALLSDCHSTALVSREGSIDWACLRRFDNPSTFARLIDHERGGFYAITLRDLTASSRRYMPGTMVLETTMESPTGSVVVTDAFAMRRGGARAPRAMLIRSVRCISGRAEVDMTVEPRFGYGAVRPWLRCHRGDLYSAVGGCDSFILATDIPLEIDRDGLCFRGSLELTAGQRVETAATALPAHQLPAAMAVHERIDVDGLLTQTMRWWQRWSESTSVDGPFAELIERSALVLKSLCCAPTGAIIAAPTTSLPEIDGGAANWDYRYCWIRDATLTLDALRCVGHAEVARGFHDFVLRSSAGHADDIQIMYGPYGERLLPESELDLDGWRGSRPVRVGNGAAAQSQLDVYGHILEAVHLWHRHQLDIDEDEWRFLAGLVDLAATRCDEPDAGIWETRGPPKHHVYSKVMLWVALDRGIRLSTHHGFRPLHRDQVERWRDARDRVRTAVDELGVDPDRGNFVQHYGATALDASLLKLPLVGFVEATDPRMVATVAAIEQELSDPHGFIHRYGGSVDGSDHTVDGASEGTFLLCSCWLVEVLTMQGQVERARRLFERLAGIGNDVLLFAEQYDPVRERFLGNFPQAFTHLGLIAAHRRLLDADAWAGAGPVPA